MTGSHIRESPAYSRDRRACHPFRWKRRRFACRKPAHPAASCLRVAKQGTVSWSRRAQTLGLMRLNVPETAVCLSATVPGNRAISTMPRKSPLERSLTCSRPGTSGSGFGYQIRLWRFLIGRTALRFGSSRSSTVGSGFARRSIDRFLDLVERLSGLAPPGA